MHSSRAILLYSGFQIAISFAWILWLSETFDLGKRVIALHVCLILSLLVVMFLSLGLVRRVLPQIKRSWFLMVVFVIMTAEMAGLLILYVGNSLSNLYWQGNLPWSFFRSSLLDINTYQTGFRLVNAWAVAVPTLIFVVSVTQSLLFLKPVTATLNQLFQNESACSLFSSRRRSLLTITATSLFGLLMSLTVWAILSPQPYPSLQQHTDSSQFLRARLIRREPILALFTADSAVDTFEDYKLSICLGQSEPAARASYPNQENFDRRNIVLIIVDSLRPDHMQIYGYHRPTTPFLHELKESRQIRLAERTVATCPESACGISSILTSKFRGNRAPRNFGLHHLLMDQGYDVHFIHSDDHNYAGLRTLYGDSLTTYFDGKSSERFPIRDDRAILEGLSTVRRFEGKPTFFFFHLMSTHVLGEKQESFQRHLPAQSHNPVSTPIPEDRVPITNAYDNGVMQADSTLRQIFEQLERMDYLENALVVITGDHGEGLGERDYGHGFELGQESVSVPLIIYDDPEFEWPRLTLARHIDIAPTIVSRLGLTIPSNWQGQSLLSSAPIEYAFARLPKAPKAFNTVFGYSIGSVFYQSEDKTYQFIRDPRLGKNAAEELYDLNNDPNENNNLIETADRTLIRHLRHKLDQNSASAVQCHNTIDSDF